MLHRPCVLHDTHDLSCVSQNHSNYSGRIRQEAIEFRFKVVMAWIMVGAAEVAETRCTPASNI